MTAKSLNRRALLAAGFAASACLSLPGFAQGYRRIPQRPSLRVIVDNDFSGDPDGLVGLAHQLLAPKTLVPLITVSGLNREFLAGDGGVSGTIEPGMALARETSERLGLAAIPTFAGGHEPGESESQPSAAASAIVAEAMREDPLPLVFACGGPLTNLAEAMRLAPQIACRMKVIWIGGGAFPEGGWEYNLATDLAAARQVIEHSNVPLATVPQPTYRQMQISVAEMEADMRPISPFASWLYDRFTTPPDFVDLGGTWPMGDSPPVLLTALSAESSRAREVTARRINDDCSYGAELSGRDLQVYDHVDARLIWADFLARLRLQAAG